MTSRTSEVPVVGALFIIVGIALVMTARPVTRVLVAIYGRAPFGLRISSWTTRLFGATFALAGVAAIFWDATR